MTQYEIEFGLKIEDSKCMTMIHNQLFKMITLLTCGFILSFENTAECSGQIDLSSTQPITIPEFYYTEPNQITSKDVEKFIPTDMEPTDNSSEVVSRIADRSLQVWAQTIGKDVSIVKAAKSVEQKLKADVDLTSSASPDDIHHRIKFNVKAFQTLAEIEYTGWTKALINYNFSRQSSSLKLSEKILSNKDFFVIGERDPIETVSSVGLSWKW